MRKKKNKRPDKRTCQTIHFKKRFLERYGIDPNRHMRREMLEMIQRRECVILDTQSCRISVLDIMFGGRHYPVVYDKKRKSLVTVLPHECLDPKVLCQQRADRAHARAEDW